MHESTCIDWWDSLSPWGQGLCEASSMAPKWHYANSFRSSCFKWQRHQLWVPSGTIRNFFSPSECLLFPLPKVHTFTAGTAAALTPNSVTGDKTEIPGSRSHLVREILGITSTHHSQLYEQGRFRGTDLGRSGDPTKSGNPIKAVNMEEGHTQSNFMTFPFQVISKGWSFLTWNRKLSKIWNCLSVSVMVQWKNLSPDICWVTVTKMHETKTLKTVPSSNMSTTYTK